MQIPQALGGTGRQLLGLLIVVSLLAIAGYLALANYREALVTPTLGALVAFLTVLAVSRFRGIGPIGSLSGVISDNLTYLAMALLGFGAVIHAESKREVHQRLIALAVAPAIYTLASATLHLIGVVSPTPKTIGSLAEGYPASVAAHLGLHINRVKFPMANSINLFSVVVAAGLTAVIVLRQRGANLIPAWAMWLGVAASAYCLLLEDSRAAMLIVVVVLAVAFWNPRARGAVGLPILIPVMPILLTYGFRILSSGLFAGLFRTRIHGSDSTGSDREVVWTHAWNVFSHSGLERLYGWGAGGHITSGASLGYTYIFGRHSTLLVVVPTHSLTIQTLMDSGLIGLVAIVAALATGMASLRTALVDHGYIACRALIAAFAVIVLSGATEVSPTYYSREALFVVILVLGAAAALEDNHRRRRFEPDLEDLDLQETAQSGAGAPRRASAGIQLGAAG